LSKKHPHHHGGPASTADLKARVERTRREGRYQQALELVKQLHKTEPTPEHLELLKETYFQRAVQLRRSGHARDAATVIEVAARLDEKNAAWLEKLAGEMARCGEVARSLALMQKVPGGSNSAALMGPLADASMLEKGTRAALPAELQRDHDAIVAAFRQLEAGQDEQVKTTLQGIGLRSPFLEWKLLVRGMQAYYQKDDERARENWLRLDPARVPARLAAPLRQAIDPAYRDAQPPATQTALKQQHEWLQGSTLQPQLRSVRQALENPDSLASAFRQVESLLPQLKAQAPHLVPRLASVLYWAILRTGPDELPRYKRVFGPPPDDPNFSRLEALAFDEGGQYDDAHVRWQHYEREIALRPESWPADQVNLARALIWLRMGDNAAAIPTAEQQKKLPRFLRELGKLPRPLKPGAVACYEKALALAPDLLEAHAALFRFHRRSDKPEAAITAGRRLLEKFPDHLDTLEDLAELYGREGQFAEELKLLQQALKHNPLDRELRGRLCQAHLNYARDQAVKEDYNQARAHYDSAVAYGEPVQQGFFACCRAACELKAGNQAAAEELLAQARAGVHSEMLLNYTMLVESIRLKLPQKLRTRFSKEFNDLVADTPTPEVAAELASYLLRLQYAGVSYHGQKTHTKKIYDYIDRLDKKHCPEDQYVEILGSLARLDPPVRMLKRFFDHGKRRFRNNPFVPYYEAVHLMGDDPEAGPPMEAMWLLDTAERLAEPRASEPAVKALLEDIANRRKLLRSFRALMPDLFGFGGFPFGFDPFEGEFDDDDDYY
jgi:tetratricopeptide (TPR) repeat protein